MKIGFKEIRKCQLGMFQTLQEGDEWILSMKNCPNKIRITLPFVLDEKVAAIAGLMPDGSLIKDLKRLYFGQEKDLSKHDLFQGLIYQLFKPNHKIFTKNTTQATESYFNSTVLCNFLYHILDFSKSDEPMKVPNWVFSSPPSVMQTYLREAYAMEGTILKKLSEVRFITKDLPYALNIKELLQKLGITSQVKPRIGGMHRRIQYRISIYGKENFRKFKGIGFTLPMHTQRFRLLCQKYCI